MKYYVDSNIFIALIFDESGEKLNLMNHYSEQFFNETLEGKHELIISKLVIKEFCKITNLSEDELNEFVKHYCGKVKISNITSKDKEEANKIDSKFHNGFADSLHYVVAKRNKCDALVTYNVKDFEFSEDLLILKPEDIIEF